MTQFSLKLLALICMLCDHAAKVVLSTGVLTPLIGMEWNLWLYTTLTIVGRISFPIFAWFVAEGCRKTKNVGKYLLRLLLFAVLSEIPFQLCFYEKIGFGCHNVIFTMLLGASGISAGKHLAEKQVPRWIAIGVPAIVVMALGWFADTDYNAWGVGLILLLYDLPEGRPRLLFLSGWINAFYLLWHGSAAWFYGESKAGILLQWMGALVSVLLLTTYHGDKGKNGKWLFYLFYPAHLALLYGIRQLFTLSVLS